MNQIHIQDTSDDITFNIEKPNISISFTNSHYSSNSIVEGIAYIDVKKPIPYIDNIYIKVSGKEKISLFEHSKETETYLVDKIVKARYLDEENEIKVFGLRLEDEYGNRYYWTTEAKQRIKNICHSVKKINNVYFNERQTLINPENGTLQPGVYKFPFSL